MSAARKVAKAAKAVIAGAIALCSGMAIASVDGHVTQPELWTVAGGVIAALGTVYGVANARTATARNTSEQRRPAPEPHD